MSEINGYNFGNFFLYTMTYNITSQKIRVELAWRSGSLMAGHAATRGSIPGGNGVKTELHALRKGR